MTRAIKDNKNAFVIALLAAVFILFLIEYMSLNEIKHPQCSLTSNTDEIGGECWARARAYCYNAGYSWGGINPIEPNGFEIECERSAPAIQRIPPTFKINESPSDYQTRLTTPGYVIGLSEGRMPTNEDYLSVIFQAVVASLFFGWFIYYATTSED